MHRTPPPLRLPLALALCIALLAALGVALLPAAAISPAEAPHRTPAQLAADLGAPVPLRDPCAVTAPPAGLPAAPTGVEIIATADDPGSDTFGAAPVYDVRYMNLIGYPGRLDVTVVFWSPIPDFSVDPNAIRGMIDIDADQWSITGNTSHLEPYKDVPTCSDPGLGMEYYVDLGIQS